MSYYKIYNGKRLGPYSYDRPPRAFTKKDLARIAKHLAQNDGDAMAVFVAVAVALGFGKLICDAARIVRSFISITTWFKQLSVILATATLTTQLLTRLNGAAIVAPIGVKVFVGIAISLTLVIQKFTIMVDSITGDIAIAHDVSTQIDEACKRVDEAQQQAFDAACDATGAACEAVKKATEDAAFLLKSDVDKAIDVLDLEKYPKWWEWL
jgi:hypothetical protein